MRSNGSLDGVTALTKQRSEVKIEWLLKLQLVVIIDFIKGKY